VSTYSEPCSFFLVQFFQADKDTPTFLPLDRIFVVDLLADLASGPVLFAVPPPRLSQTASPSFFSAVPCREGIARFRTPPSNGLHLLHSKPPSTVPRLFLRADAFSARRPPPDLPRVPLHVFRTFQGAFKGDSIVRFLAVPQKLYVSCDSSSKEFPRSEQAISHVIGLPFIRYFPAVDAPHWLSLRCSRSECFVTVTALLLFFCTEKPF